MDFLRDELFDGRRIRVLTIVDNFTRANPAIGVKARYQATEVVETLGGAVQEYGMPKRIRVGDGPEFVSKELDLWADTRGVILDFSRPGKPTDHAFIEAFNSGLRQECLNQPWFLSLKDARSKIEAWRWDYNGVRPHSALGNLPPVVFAKSPVQACLDSEAERPDSLT